MTNIYTMPCCSPAYRTGIPMLLTLFNSACMYVQPSFLSSWLFCLQDADTNGQQRKSARTDTTAIATFNYRNHLVLGIRVPQTYCNDILTSRSFIKIVSALDRFQFFVRGIDHYCSTRCIYQEGMRSVIIPSILQKSR